MDNTFFMKIYFQVLGIYFFDKYIFMGYISKMVNIFAFSILYSESYDNSTYFSYVNIILTLNMFFDNNVLKTELKA